MTSVLIALVLLLLFVYVVPEKQVGLSWEWY